MKAGQMLGAVAVVGLLAVSAGQLQAATAIGALETINVRLVGTSQEPRTTNVVGTVTNYIYKTKTFRFDTKALLAELAEILAGTNAPAHFPAGSTLVHAEYPVVTVNTNVTPAVSTTNWVDEIQVRKGTTVITNVTHLIAGGTSNDKFRGRVSVKGNDYSESGTAKVLASFEVMNGAVTHLAVAGAGTETGRTSWLRNGRRTETFNSTHHVAGELHPAGDADILDGVITTRGRGTWDD